MMNQFSPKVSEILSFSREEAKRLTSKSVAPEHIMLSEQTSLFRTYY